MGWRRGLFLGLCLTLAVGFAALGAWQTERLGWKRDLIRVVEARLADAAAPPPAWDAWSPDMAYARVVVRGVFLHDRETAVQAVTALGPGWWVMTPLRTPAGIVMVNRGYVPTDLRDAASRPQGQIGGEVEIVGLLRADEPGGGFLRANAPADGRWYSRDIDAMAQAQGLQDAVAPYFIDADATPNAGGYPIGGMTVVHFRNHHLSYLLTWFALSLLSLGGAVIVWRHGRRR